MAVILDEGFEETADGGADGYDETIWTEGVSGSGSLDPDNSDISRPSPGGGDECLKTNVTSDIGKAYIIGDLASAQGDSYSRFYVYVNTFTNGRYLFRVRDSADAKVFEAYTRSPGTSGWKLRMRFWHDGLQNQYEVDNLSLDTWYRIEVQWIASTDTWEWRLDGVTQNSGSLTSTHPTDIHEIMIGSLGNFSGYPQTTYFDLVKIQDDDWCGEEGGVDVTVTPDALSLTSGIQAESLSLGATLSPAALSMTLAAQGETVLFDYLMSVAVQTLASSPQAPTILAGIIVAVNSISLVLGPQEETIRLGVTLSPAALSLVSAPQGETVNYGATLSLAALSLASGPQTETVNYGATLSQAVLSLLADPQTVTVLIPGGVTVTVSAITVQVGPQTVLVVPWKQITLQGIEAISGEDVYIIGRYH